MLALCLMLSKTYYVQNYAGIIGLGLTVELTIIYDPTLICSYTNYNLADKTHCTISIFERAFTVTARNTLGIHKLNV